MIQLLLLFIAGAAKGVMDSLQYHYDKSIFYGLKESFWNPQVSWKNKWKNAEAKEEKFFLSSSMFVFVTDGWHLFQFIMINSIFIAFTFHLHTIEYTTASEWMKSLLDYYWTMNVFLRYILNFIVARAAFGAGFVLFYNKLLIRK